MKNTILPPKNWQLVSNEVLKINSSLHNIIEQLSPSAEYKFYDVTYEYGDEILKNGKFHLPVNGELIPFENPIFDDIRHDLGYNKDSNPVMLVMNNSLEFFVTLQERIIPFFTMQPGDVYGTWDVFDNLDKQELSFIPTSIWDMTAGARSVFMLPKISEQHGHDRLQRAFDFTLEKPKEMRDHWHIFKAMYQSNAFKQKWQTRVLLFSRKWFEERADNAWRDFREFFYSRDWKYSEFWRSQFSWYLTFSRIQSNRNIKPSPYHSDVVKHLFLLATGAIPGLVPAVDDTLGPIKRIQEIYEDIYGLKNWASIIMQPQTFSPYRQSDPIYYSLQYPSAIELATRPSNRASVITDTYLVRGLLEKYLYDIEKSALNVEGTHLFELTKNVNFDFFHVNVEEYPKMRSNAAILEEDTRFEKACENKQFPHTSTFFKGCVRISNK